MRKILKIFLLKNNKKAQVFVRLVSRLNTEKPNLKFSKI